MSRRDISRPRSAPRCPLIRRLVLCIPVGAIALLGCHPARADEAIGWSRVKVCLDSNLPTLLRGDRAAVEVVRTVHALCAVEIEEAEQQASQAMTHLANASQKAAAVRYFRVHLDSAMLDYIGRFQAKGGPTLLDPTR